MSQGDRKIVLCSFNFYERTQIGLRPISLDILKELPVGAVVVLESIDKNGQVEYVEDVVRDESR